MWHAKVRNPFYKAFQRRRLVMPLPLPFGCSQDAHAKARISYVKYCTEVVLVFDVGDHVKTMPLPKSESFLESIPKM